MKDQGILDGRETRLEFGRVNTQLEFFHEVSKLVDQLKNAKADQERLERLEHLVENQYTRMDNFEDNRKKIERTLQ